MNRYRVISKMDSDGDILYSPQRRIGWRLLGFWTGWATGRPGVDVRYYTKERACAFVEKKKEADRKRKQNKVLHNKVVADCECEGGDQ